jgi:hypothetical protein
MAADASNDIIFFLHIDAKYKSDLAHIRAWDNVKVTFDQNSIWLKDFTYAQIHSVEVKSVPYKLLFYSKEGKLYLMNSLLPDRNIPSGLWTPIDRAFPITLPSFNHNYFGVKDQIELLLIPSENEAAAYAMITSAHNLNEYISTAAQLRFENIKWTILNNDQVLLLGIPILPIKGDVYWRRGSFLIPNGYDFDLPELSDTVNTKINPDNTHWIVWSIHNTYAPIEYKDLIPLSLSSYRLSKQHHNF